MTGADGYLVKSDLPGNFERVFETLGQLGAPMTPRASRTLLGLVRQGSDELVPSRHGLTPREHEVLRLLVRGLSYREAAAELGISVDTVRSHVRKLYRKLGVNSATQAAVVALRLRLV